MNTRWLLSLSLVSWVGICPHFVSGQVADLQSQVAELLLAKCIECHSGPDAKGELELTTSPLGRTTGEGTPLVESRRPDASALWQRIAADEMPPEHPLNDAEKSAVAQWINSGAPWNLPPLDRFQQTTSSRAGLDWWSLRPLQDFHREAVPAQAQPAIGGHDDSVSATTTSSPIDHFVREQLAEHHLAPSIPADRRTLIRRLTFDMLGLPPTPAEVYEFVEDERPLAYELLVERLLASPHYGERWARHWLDVVRFGESHGFEYNEPRNNAWPYRNWVIDALNRDMPYDEFVRWQLAGDVLEPNNPDAIAATGFLVAGPHNTTKPAVKNMQDTMRHDELEDIVGAIGQTFLGLTANCARCHDHKFDPITQREYYQLVASVVGIDHGERTIPDTNYAQAQAQLQSIKTAIAETDAKIAQLERDARERIAEQRAAKQRVTAERSSASDAAATTNLPQPRFSWDFRLGSPPIVNSPPIRLHGGARLTAGGLEVGGDGYAESEVTDHDFGAKTIEVWVQLSDLSQQGGAALSVQTPDGGAFDAIVFGERDVGQWMAGSEGFARTQSFQGPRETDAEQHGVHVAIAYDSDGTIRAYRNGEPYGQPYRSSSLRQFAAGQTTFLFGLRHSPAGGNRFLQGTILQANVYNRSLTGEDIAASASQRGGIITRDELRLAMLPAESQRYEQLQSRRQEFQEQLTRLQQIQPVKTYAAISQATVPVRVLSRGEVTQPGEEVVPAGLRAISSAPADFGLSDQATDGERRIALAHWITDNNNALFARVIANRIWHFHFGKGFVPTTNDLGFNGGQPTHPQLLDWLASELQRSNWSLKQLHRVIVNSATYRQSSAADAKAMAIDADNRWLWRTTPRRLEAEELRDAMLSIAGTLNPTIGGVGYRDMREYKYLGSHYYDPVEPNAKDPNQLRRTIYRFSPRGAKRTMLDTFDCPDPSTKTPVRESTITPVQALSLLNNDFVLQTAEQFAVRLGRNGESPDKQVALAYELAFSRLVSPEEALAAEAFIRTYGLVPFCRAILNSNEFLFVR